MPADPIELEVFKHLFHSITEEMGASLRRTAFSPNIKERRDYSCALFDAAGQALAMGDHMPVHLGSMPMSVRAAITELALAPGDIAMLNDPFRGGTHLPDITVVAPVFLADAKHNASLRRTNLAAHRAKHIEPSRRAHPPAVPAFFVAARAHHADVGGAYAGSMGPCREIYQEGFRIPPVKIVRGGELDRDLLALLLNNVRTPAERDGDLRAQLAACHTGIARLQDLCARYGSERVQRAGRSLLHYSEQMMRAFLATVAPGTYAAEDFLDDDGVSDDPVRIAVRITFPRAGKSASRQPRPVIVDFTGSSPQVAGSINAVEAITWSACFYVFRCLLRDDVPATAGLMRPIQLIAPAGSVINALPPAAVAGGNVETSQRIVDVLLRALAPALPDRIPAASSGTMNNLTIGGFDDRNRDVSTSSGQTHRETAAQAIFTICNPERSRGIGGSSAATRILVGQDPQGLKQQTHVPVAVDAVPFAYYETIAGGSGATPAHDGVSGVHTHMTNSLNTPVEALEHSYPFRVVRYGLRSGDARRAARSRGLATNGGDVAQPGSAKGRYGDDAQLNNAARQPREHDNVQRGDDGPGRESISSNGKYRGGDGIVRELELLTDATVTLLSDRRKTRPYGLNGGADGAPGRTTVLRADGSTEILPSKCSTQLRRGDRIRITTPGGGGWGPPQKTDDHS